MKPRPFYCWKSFWLGVVVFAFMGWVMWKGGDNDYYLTLGWGSSGYVQATKLEGIGAVAFDPTESRGISFESRSRDPLLGSFPHEAYWSYLQRTGSSLRYVVVQDRVVFFSFLGLWGGWLIWQWSREQKKLESP